MPSNITNDAGAACQATARGGAGGAAPVVLPDGGIVDVPYVCESPFEGVAFVDYFYLDDFEELHAELHALVADHGRHFQLATERAHGSAERRD